MDDIKNIVGKNLQDCRKSLNLTQKEVANKMGVAQPVYQRFEKGVFECDYSQLIKLCEIYDVSLDYLFGRKEY